MSRLIARIPFVCLVGALSTVCIANEEAEPDIVLSSGILGGGYWSAAARLQGVAEEMSFSVENLPVRQRNQLSDLVAYN